MIWVQICTLTLCLGLLIGWYIYVFVITFNSAPFLPSRRKDIHTVFENLKLGKKDRFIDVGSGDGRIVLAALKSGAGHAVGLELNPFLSLWSRIYLLAIGYRNFEIINGNMFKYDFSSYNVVYLYLLPKSVQKLVPQIWQQLKPESLLITNTFAYKDLRPIKTVGKISIYKKQHEN